jgi:hypothetical protein
VKVKSEERMDSGESAVATEGQSDVQNQTKPVLKPKDLYQLVFSVLHLAFLRDVQPSPLKTQTKK